MLTLQLGKIVLSHGKPMTLGQGANGTSPIPTEGLMDIIEMFSNFLCWLMQNCEALGV